MRRRSNVLAGRHSADPVEPVIWLWYSDVEFINRAQGSRACTPQTHALPPWRTWRDNDLTICG